ncbi:hypothetical protein QBC40DRAFT_64719 [Triangularia verruculosa]|uniref:DUF7357 domain-containing protein n=1 Tax=Triangularia verruculosa TaxID=2587418 RepID=A0AAN7AXH0_9PEZI|nr:hypothetical protein QBC40DRAFT_64719 [Triangularia verruculosa]
MRLRLVVRRHALPDVRVVFSYKTESEPTIAGLLEQVNEVIPLESNEWGLEDYTVELRQKDTGTAYDCLHFQQVADVLKDDEEVYIRPLVTDDRRKRRLSGRDQITNDGRHLLDGIPFGRPRLRAAYSRPAVDIPPLKRPRLTYHPHGEEDEDDDTQQLMITQSGERGGRRSRGIGTVRFDTPYNADEDENAEDDDYDCQESRQDEADVDSIDEDDLEEEHLDHDAHDDAGLEEDDESDLEAELRDLQNDAESHEAVKSNTTVHQQTSHGRRKAREVEAPIDAEGRGTKRSRDDEEPEDSDTESVASVVKHYDQHGFPSGSILNGTASRHMVEEMREQGASVNLPVHTKFEDDIECDNEALDEDADDSSHKSLSDHTSDVDNDSDSDSGPEVASSKVSPPLPGSAPDSSSASSSDNNNDSSDNEDETDNEVQAPAGTERSDQSAKVEEEDDDSESDSSSEGSSDNETDNDGDSNSDDDEGADSASDQDTDEEDDDSDGDQDSNPPDVDLDSDEDLEDAEDKDNSDPAENSSNKDSDDESNSDSSNDSSINSSDDDSSPADDESSQELSSSSDEDSSENESSSDDESPSDDDTSVDKEHVAPEPKKAVPSPVKPPAITKAPAGQDESTNAVRPGQGKPSTRKRNARRRALAQAKKAAARAEASVESAPGAGMTKADSAELADIADALAAKKAEMLERMETLTGMIVEELRGDSQTQEVSTNPSVPVAAASCRLSPEAPVAVHKETPHDTEEDPDAWRAKINYRAVECCQEGVVLSEPPFPFVQRWDPQQKYQHGGRKKRKQRNQDEYQYQDDETPKSKKRRSDAGDTVSYYHDESTSYGDTTLNYDDEPQEQPEQPEEGGFDIRAQEEEEDLPPLPTDISTLPVLQPGSAAPGMILTWQQLLMSKATNWAPQVSRLTGVIVNLEADGAVRLRLAKRDQNLDRNEKVYDDDGNRVYDKFELPGMDDDEEEAEEGYRTLDLSEMMEPHVLQFPSQVVPGTPLLQEPSPSHTIGNLEKTTSAQTSATLGHEASEQSADETSQMDINTQTLEESMIPETCVRNSSSDHQDAQAVQAMSVPVEDISMTEDRRHEISQLISEAGFRKEVDPSITNDALSNRSSNSPSRQLADMSHDVLPRPFESSQPQSDMGSRPASRGTSNGVDSQPILLEPFNGFSDAISLPPSEHRVEYPKLDLPPSDIGSVQSGRQVDPDFSIDLADSSFNALEDDSAQRDIPPSSPPFGMDDEAGEVGTHKEEHGEKNDENAEEEEEEEEDAPTPRPSRVMRALSESSSSSDSSLPSVSELCTQSSTNNSSGMPARSPALGDVISKSKARTSMTTADAEYEEAMRRLDDMEDDSEKPDGVDSDSDSEGYNVGKGPSKLARKLMERPIGKPSARKSKPNKQSSVTKVKREPVFSQLDIFKPDFSQTARPSSSQFQIPEGSQVVSLLTSSPEPAVEENYAEDDIDETYKDSQDSDWPGGGGWVTKRRPAAAAAAARRVGLSKRGMSVPASSLGSAREKTSIPRRIANSQQPPTASSQGLARARKRIADGIFYK